MTGPTASPAHPLRPEAAAAGKSDHLPPGPDPAAGPSQRERSKALLVGNIRQAVADLVLAPGPAARTKNSDYLSRRLSHDYTYLANLFSEATGSTIEQYIIACRIEWVKELLGAGELNLTQISYKCKYSSVAHLSNQFRKVTGLTPSAFRKRHLKHGIVPESVNDATKFCNYVNTLEVRRVSFAT